MKNKVTKTYKYFNEQYLFFLKFGVIPGIVFLIVGAIIVFFISKGHLPRGNILNSVIMLAIYIIGGIVGWWKLVYKEKHKSNKNL